MELLSRIMRHRVPVGFTSTKPSSPAPTNRPIEETIDLSSQQEATHSSNIHPKRTREYLDLDDTERVKENCDHDGDADEYEDLTVRIDPPPKNVYDSFKKCEDAVHLWCKGHGYDVVRGKPSKNAKAPSKKKDQIHKYIYKCGKAGQPKNSHKLTDETRRRKRRASRKTGCGMGIIVAATNAQDVSGGWEVRYRENDKSFFHNHKPDYAGAISAYSRRDRKWTNSNISSGSGTMYSRAC